MLRYLFGSGPPKTQLDSHPLDDVYPFHLLDDIKIHRAAILNFTLHFNDVLDVQKVHDSLKELLEIGDWRKLGGRIRVKV